MHVLIVSNGVPVNNDSLIGLFEFDQAKALASAGMKVTFMAIDMRSVRRWRRWGITQGYEKNFGWYNLSIPIGKVRTRLLQKIGSIAIKKLYKKVFKENKPDIIHAHFTLMGAIAGDLAKTEGIPLVVTEHSSMINDGEIRSDLKMCAEEAYMSANIVIAVSKALAYNIKRQMGINCQIIPNIMGNNVFYNVCKVKHKGIGFITTCNIIQHKRPVLLLEAFCVLRKKYEDIFLGFIGEGDQLYKVQEIIEREGLDGIVRCYGKKKREDIADIYRHYDCFVLPSYRETFGVAYIEAMAAGLPIIATKCGGPEDFVESTCGILINVDNKDELINAMTDMYHHIDHYNADTIRKMAKERFSEKTITEKIISVYKSLV